jgi:hypothetical protein
LSLATAKSILGIRDAKETTMNWIFETYSNVYNTAMMQDTNTVRFAAANKPVRKGLVARLFSR